MPFPGTILTAAETELEAHGIKLWEVSDPVHAWGLMAWIGDSIGDNALAVRKHKVVSKVLSRFPDTSIELVARTVVEDYDGVSHGTVTKTIAEWVVELVEWSSRGRWANGMGFDYFVKTIFDMKSLKQAIREDYYDYSDSVRCISLLTDSEQEQADKLAERRRLESAARELADRYGVSVDTLDFIRACDRELDRFEDYRYGMREDGLCIGYGVTAAQWQDEFNASQSDTVHVREILDWLRGHCPMLWAEYQEAVRSGRWNDGE